MPDFQGVADARRTRGSSRASSASCAGPPGRIAGGLPGRAACASSTAPTATWRRCSAASRHPHLDLPLQPAGWSRTRASGRSGRAPSRTGSPTPCTSGSPQEFVDRHGTVIARHDASELVTSVDADGEVLVQGLRAGVLEGFRFRPDREVRRGLAGARWRPRTARSDPRARARGGARARGRRGVRCSGRGPRSCGGARRWRGSWRARARSRRRWTCCGSDLLDAPLRERVRRRLAAWSRRTCARRSRPLFALRDGAPPGRRRAGSRSRSPRGWARCHGAPWPPRSRRSTAGRPARARRPGVTLGRLASSCPRCSARRPCGCARASSRCARAAPADGPGRPPSSRSTPGRRPPSTWPAATSPPGRARSASTGSSARPPSPRACRATGRSCSARARAVLGCRADEVAAVLAAHRLRRARRPLRARLTLRGPTAACVPSVP